MRKSFDLVQKRQGPLRQIRLRSGSGTLNGQPKLGQAEIVTQDHLRFRPISLKQPLISKLIACTLQPSGACRLQPACAAFPVCRVAAFVKACAVGVVGRASKPPCNLHLASARSKTSSLGGAHTLCMHKCEFEVGLCWLFYHASVRDATDPAFC